MYLHSCVPSLHRETISQIAFLPSVSWRSHDCGGGGGERLNGGEGKVVSVCKDGTLCFWKSNLTLQRMVTVSAIINVSQMSISL